MCTYTYTNTYYPVCKWVPFFCADCFHLFEQAAIDLLWLMPVKIKCDSPVESKMAIMQKHSCNYNDFLKPLNAEEQAWHQKDPYVVLHYSAKHSWAKVTMINKNEKENMCCGWWFTLIWFQNMIIFSQIQHRTFFWQLSLLSCAGNFVQFFPDYLCLHNQRNDYEMSLSLFALLMMSISVVSILLWPLLDLAFWMDVV